MKINKLFLITIFSIFSMYGCTERSPMIMPNDPGFAPVQPSDMQPPPALDGSLYQQGYAVSLFGDRKAYRVGDLITIVLQESTRSSKNAKTEIKKKSETSLKAPVFGGNVPLNISAELGGTSGFSGSGGSNQSNSLTGNITVTVQAVYPNGNLLVRGEKWLTLNQGSEFIRVSGIVRPDDISPSNTVSSQRLADARLAYSGTGDLAESNKQGWLSKFFNSSWYPF